MNAEHSADLVNARKHKLQDPAKLGKVKDCYELSAEYEGEHDPQKLKALKHS